jgi:hypothetical protein
MPHFFTNTEYADMLYVYGFCERSASAAVEECRRRFPVCRIPDCRVFSRVFSTLGGTWALPNAHDSSERARQQHLEEQENILEMVKRSPTTSMCRLSTHLSVSRTRVLVNIA